MLSYFSAVEGPMGPTSAMKRTAFILLVLATQQEVARRMLGNGGQGAIFCVEAFVATPKNLLKRNVKTAKVAPAAIMNHGAEGRGDPQAQEAKENIKPEPFIAPAAAPATTATASDVVEKEKQSLLAKNRNTEKKQAGQHENIKPGAPKSTLLQLRKQQKVAAAGDSSKTRSESSGVLQLPEEKATKIPGGDEDNDVVADQHQTEPQKVPSSSGEQDVENEAHDYEDDHSTPGSEMSATTSSSSSMVERNSKEEQELQDSRRRRRDGRRRDGRRRDGRRRSTSTETASTPTGRRRRRRSTSESNTNEDFHPKNCPFLTLQNEVRTTTNEYEMECNDGTVQNPHSSSKEQEDWANADACVSHGGRARCPLGHGMCAYDNDCAGGKDFCCMLPAETGCNEGHGGVRKCPEMMSSTSAAGGGATSDQEDTSDYGTNSDLPSANGESSDYGSSSESDYNEDEYEETQTTTASTSTTTSTTTTTTTSNPACPSEKKLQCPWQCPWDPPVPLDTNEMLCGDNTVCNVGLEGWSCCNAHGGRKVCPNGYQMCAQNSKCKTDCSTAGGLRACEDSTTTPPPPVVQQFSASAAAPAPVVSTSSNAVVQQNRNNFDDSHSKCKILSQHRAKSDSINVVFLPSGFSSGEISNGSWKNHAKRIYRELTNRYAMFNADENEGLNMFYVNEKAAEDHGQLCKVQSTLLLCEVEVFQAVARHECGHGFLMSYLIVHNDAVSWAGAAYSWLSAATITLMDQGIDAAAHELSHSMFGLGDEYAARQSTATRKPNCDHDKQGCLNRIADLRAVFGDEKVGTCVYGYCENNAYYIAKESIMIYISLQEFGYASERVGCCKYYLVLDVTPPYCEKFNSNGLTPLRAFCKDLQQQYEAHTEVWNYDSQTSAPAAFVEMGKKENEHDEVLDSSTVDEKNPQKKLLLPPAGAARSAAAQENENQMPRRRNVRRTSTRRSKMTGEENNSFSPLHKVSFTSFAEVANRDCRFPKLEQHILEGDDEAFSEHGAAHVLVEQAVEWVCKISSASGSGGGNTDQKPKCFQAAISEENEEGSADLCAGMFQRNEVHGDVEDTSGENKQCTEEQVQKDKSIVKVDVYKKKNPTSGNADNMGKESATFDRSLCFYNYDIADPMPPRDKNDKVSLEEVRVPRKSFAVILQFGEVIFD
ncbi:unnamed protein product [Amoebophrya sp. A120]|nr:unnamed protein product [Amoebophrya sp. A120]|eukprot:GSA120T00007287001.1